MDKNEQEFAHIVNKEMPFEEMILELKNCGILLSPWKEDIEAVGLKEKV